MSREEIVKNDTPVYVAKDFQPLAGSTSLSCQEFLAFGRINQFLTGDTWGIQISQKLNKCNLPYYQSVADNLAEEDWEWIDSCFGLYGDDGLMEFNSAIEQWGSK